MKKHQSNNAIIAIIVIALLIVAGVAFQQTQSSNEVPGGVNHAAGISQGNNGGE